MNHKPNYNASLGINGIIFKRKPGFVNLFFVPTAAQGFNLGHPPWA